jgi:hypothetical protein
MQAQAADADRTRVHGHSVHHSQLVGLLATQQDLPFTWVPVGDKSGEVPLSACPRGQRNSRVTRQACAVPHLLPDTTPNTRSSISQ